MITFAAFVPHSPLLIDSVGKENTVKLAQSRKAFLRLSEDLYISKPETLLMISTHGSAHHDAFSVHVHDPFVVDFHEFGDLSTHDSFTPDLELIASIQQRMLHETIPFTLDSHANLDYSVSVPLTLLSSDHANPKLVPVIYSRLDAKSHVVFGRILNDVCQTEQKRIAVIATGNLSHALSTDAPAGFRPEGEIFDKTIQQAIEQVSTTQLLSLDSEMVSRAFECSLLPLLILFGMLEHMNVRPEIISYEHPFGVGQLVAEFHLGGN